MIRAVASEMMKMTTTSSIRLKAEG